MVDLLNQLPLPIPGLALEPTPAMRDGRDRVTQCAECGLLAYVPDCAHYRATTKLGACPRCSRSKWWPQRLPVGPFRRTGSPEQEPAR
jgi:hypothetical protein